MLRDSAFSAFNRLSDTLRDLLETNMYEPNTDYSYLLYYIVILIYRKYSRIILDIIIDFVI